MSCTIEVTVEKQEPLRAELEAFLRCVRDRSRPLVDGADGVAAVELATRVAEAIDVLLVDIFLEAYAQPPQRIVLDLDVTDTPLPGEQEARFFRASAPRFS